MNENSLKSMQFELYKVMLPEKSATTNTYKPPVIQMADKWVKEK